jgi:hypothetical protein
MLSSEDLLVEDFIPSPSLKRLQRISTLGITADRCPGYLILGDTNVGFTLSTPEEDSSPKKTKHIVS